MLGLEGFRTPPDEDIKQQKSASEIVPSDQSHRSMPVGATPHVSIPSVISSSNVIVQSRSFRCKRMRKKHAEEPSWSSRQPSGMNEALEHPYTCRTCGKRYAQPGGVMRHYREKHNHNPNSCAYCGAGWSRPYQYKNHLEMHHRDVDPDLVLGKPAGSRRRAKVTGGGRTQNVSPHVVQHDGQSQVAPQRLQPMRPLPAVVKIPQIPQVPTVFSYAEELAQPPNNVVDHSPRFLRALPGGFTTANWQYSSRPVTAHIPLPCPPVGEYHGDQVSADPVFEPPEFINLSHSPLNMFTPLG